MVVLEVWGVMWCVLVGMCVYERGVRHVHSKFIKRAVRE